MAETGFARLGIVTPHPPLRGTFSQREKGTPASVLAQYSTSERPDVDYAVVVALQVLSGIATLVIVSLGLAVVFGMMRVINLAHGEFLMLGGYCAILAHGAGINI